MGTRAADRMTLRVAASLSLKRLVDDNIIYRTKQGSYAYSAPLFGDFLRREHG
jgi:hypothetical protein